MPDLLRQEIAATSRRIVIKVGTRVLTHADGRLNTDRVAQLSQEIYELKQSGRQVALVSSGAVGAGVSQLGLKQRPADLATLQAVAAVGQAHLIQEYDRNFGQHGCHAAQVLLTADDLHDRTRYLNVRNTLLMLLELGAIPIINENDTVAVEELMTTFGDNDRLAALVTNLLRASLLVILSDIEGLYDGPPGESGTALVTTVPVIDETVLSYVRDKKNSVSIGGMASKLEAARIATTAGENVIIASGRTPGALRAIFQAEPVGTLFLSQGKSVSPWKRWIGFTAPPRGRYILDAGACQAIARDGRSLLPIGIRGVEGSFHKGDVVAMINEAGLEIARGLTNYNDADARKIAGLRSERIAESLGHCPYVEVVHRDNLLVTTR
jgi:glutamate 5-kinase